MTSATKSLTCAGRDCCDDETCATATPETCPVRMSWSVASRARIYRQPGSARVFWLARDLVFGLSFTASLANFDPASSCWKTCQLSLPGMEVSLLEDLPRWGMTRGGVLYQRRTPERPTFENDGSVWPTPNVPNGGRTITGEIEWKGPTTAYRPDGQKVQVDLRSAVQHWLTPKATEIDETVEAWDKRRRIPKNKMMGPSLSVAIKIWATPAARDWKSGKASQETMKGNSRPLNEQVTNWATPTSSMITDGDMAQAKFHSSERPNYQSVNTGSLNPDWVEALMGYPPGWTDPAIDGRPDRENPSATESRPALQIVETIGLPGSKHWVTPWSPRLSIRWRLPFGNGLTRRLNAAWVRG